MTIPSLWRPASEKRQGTKSRWVGHSAVRVAMGIWRLRAMREGFADAVAAVA